MTTEIQEAPLRRIPIAIEALEDAFENNASEVHSYMHIESGEVVRIVDGVADPAMHTRIASSPLYLKIHPVSSREQYRWMERFIATVADGPFKLKLLSSIDGKGAFRRFKDILMTSAIERERWFAFRSERLRAVIQTWLANHHLEAEITQSLPPAQVPTADEATAPAVPPFEAQAAENSKDDALRARILQLVQQVPSHQLDAAVAYLEFLLLKH